MSFCNKNQPPVGVPSPQGYPTERYPKDAYPPPDPPQGYTPQGHPSPYGQPPPQQQQSTGPDCMNGWLKTRKMAGLTQDSNTNATGAAMKAFGTRKAILHISSSNKNHISRKKKVTAGADEVFHEEDIAMGEFQQGHEECMKAQHWERSMDMDYIFETLELAHGFPKELPSLELPKSPPREMMEVPILEQSSFYSSLESLDDYQFENDENDISDCFSFESFEPLELAQH